MTGGPSAVIWIRSLALSAMLVASVGMAAETRPNVIVFLADDLGYSDVGFNGCREIPTPHLDRLARSGVRFTAGYASHSYCSPSRAGLLTGRHQQRFGHEANPASGSADGLPRSEVLLPALLQRAGYRTAAIGKWHLGDDPKYWPTERGFDEWFGFSGGGMSYWGDARRPLAGVLRNGKPVPREELTYLTDDFSREAVAFIERNRERPFFLYLAYNAPHAPDQVTREHLAQVEHIEYGQRAVYGGLVAGMDAGIGRVLNKLDDLRLRERTLIFFYSDNGGRLGGAVNFPYRGHKGMLFEGGIRVPFCVAWPERIAAGRTIHEPITALDIVPTVLAAAHVEPAPRRPLDGLNLLPHLPTARSDEAPTPIPERTLVWRYAAGADSFGYAVRQGKWKLVYSAYKQRKLLFDLQADPEERTDLAPTDPERVARLRQAYDRWAKPMMPPRWLDPHGPNIRREEAALQSAFERASRGER